MLVIYRSRIEQISSALIAAYLIRPDKKFANERNAHLVLLRNPPRLDHNS
jgi:hypothetical protein